MGNDPHHDRGYAGEQAMGFFLGEQGYFFVEGPGGAKGHTVTTAGFDGVAYNPKTGHLIIYDNKAVARVSNVSSATAIDPVRQLGENLDKLIERVQNTTDLPHQGKLLNLLRQTRTAMRLGSKWPDHVHIAVSNAHGQATGISDRLRSTGIRFIDYYQAPRPVLADRLRAALSNQALAGAIGTALGAFFQWLGDIGIERAIRNRLETDLAPGIRRMRACGEGVLIIIALQEWTQADFNGMRARALLDVYITGGSTEQTARTTWEGTPRVLQGAAKGWRVLTRYGWIPPIAL